ISRLVGEMRAFRLGTTHTDGTNSLVATFLGPATFIWAAWTLNVAQRDGIRRLYFAARDGYLVWRAAHVLSPRFGAIECRYLKISRQAVLLPSIEEISPSGISWLRRPWELPELDRLLRKLGLSWEEVEQGFSSLHAKYGKSTILGTDEQWDQFW